jgi:hypothetical protein
MEELRRNLSAAVTDAAESRAELQNRVNARSVDAEEVTKGLLQSRYRIQEGRDARKLQDGNGPSRAYQEQVRNQGALIERTSGDSGGKVVPGSRFGPGWIPKKEK